MILPAPPPFLQGITRRRASGCHAPIDWGDHHGLDFLDPDGNLPELVGYRPGAAR